jgi:hypothetical protein
MKRMRNPTKPPCGGRGIAIINGIPTVDPNTMNLTDKTGICTVCRERVRIYQNGSGVWVPHILLPPLS